MELLREALFVVGFREGIDVLVVCGDMIDRGRASYDVAQFCRHTEGVFPLKGNHEAMMTDAMRSGGEHELQWLQNGGADWYLGYSKGVLKDLSTWFDSLPVAIEIEVDGVYNFLAVHAAYPFICEGEWSAIKAVLDKGGDEAKQIEHFMLWDRRVLSGMGDACVPYFDAVVHGHSIQDYGVCVKGNRVYADTGAFLGGDDGHGLTILHHKPNEGVLALFESYLFSRDPWTGRVVVN